MLRTPGVPGMVGRTSPVERPDRPLAVPTLLRASTTSAESGLGLSDCLAADERLRRCPAEAGRGD